eukprot:596789-Prymnesium_polylepis.1
MFFGSILSGRKEGPGPTSYHTVILTILLRFHTHTRLTYKPSAPCGSSRFGTFQGTHGIPGRGFSCVHLDPRLPTASAAPVLTRDAARLVGCGAAVVSVCMHHHATLSPARTGQRGRRRRP